MGDLTKILQELEVQRGGFGEYAPYYYALHNNAKVKKGDLSNIYQIVEDVWEKLNNKRISFRNNYELTKIIEFPPILNYLKNITIKHNGFATNEELLEFLEANITEFAQEELNNEYEDDEDDPEDVPGNPALELVSYDNNIGSIIWKHIEVGISYSCIPDIDPGSFDWNQITFKDKTFYIMHYNL